MWRNSYGYGYTSVAEKKAKAQKQFEKLKKKNPDMKPVVVEGRRIAKTWWGKAWVDNLKSYADYSNRIGRGSAYVTNGMVLDLQISTGRIDAVVAGSGSKPYNVSVVIEGVDKRNWKAITTVCGKSIANIDMLAEGKFPKAMETLFTQKGKGLFPSPDEIRFSCSCPDWAYMCKHVAAVMYATAARLDEEPLLFFTLRNVDFTDLLKRSVEEKMDNMLKNADKKTSRMMGDADAKELFGI
ncbi:MAG: SWIM zinc finger family protein [Clostridiales Family XIII bacterium]|nr:SWIM zinc finger family protein [Clostridiales Family XIII bacterium]